ncbi:MAG: energy-coupling factor ABC transporter ATP-binding protein [Lachnospiraceae bacterium]|nr:energy-coupling factor ABC transporter ATP-binding protein [Lachnospiraceae bacterium]
MEILKVENLSFTYPLCNSPAIKDVSFSVNKGEFVTICGATGCGKSTLLRMLKKELMPLGEKSGKIYINSVLQEDLSDKESAYKVGFVMQNPENQIVTDKVWHELAFGLENMNLKRDVIARRIAEMSAYFGIESWYDKNVSELSGGQKQLLNLASVMVMQPDILILDEPTAQLDPIAASDFIATVKKLGKELGITIIMVEHRLEEVIQASDKLLVMEKGRVICYDEPKCVVENLRDKPELLCAMPVASRLYHKVKGEGDCPLNISEGRHFIENNFKNDIRSLEKLSYEHSEEKALEFKDVFFRYEKNSKDVLNGLNMTVYKNEIFCILGGNGSGKTTTLSAAANLLKIYSGKIKVFGKKLKDYKNQTLYKECLTLLPQDVQTLFLKNTVREELMKAKIGVELLPFDLSYLFDLHPYDLSGGEQQLVALAKVLATKPKLLLLDEPTKGLDAYAKIKLIKIIKDLKEMGITIVMVTHDVEFASLCADRVAMFFRGNIVSVGTSTEFFSENNFYTTGVSKMTRGYFDGVVNVEEAGELCIRNGKK